MTEIIPNGTGAEVREDINDEFTKLESAKILPLHSVGNIITSVLPSMTSESNDIVTITASDTAIVAGGVYPWGIINSDNYWFTNEIFSNGSGSAQFNLTFLQPKRIKSYSFKSLYTASYYLPLSWTFEGSNNITEWTILDSRIDVAPQGTTLVSFDIPSYNTNYKYYRMNVSKVVMYTGTDRFSLYNFNVSIIESAVNALPYPASPTEGQTVFDIDTKKIETYHNGTWY